MFKRSQFTLKNLLLIFFTCWLVACDSSNEPTPAPQLSEPLPKVGLVIGPQNINAFTLTATEQYLAIAQQLVTAFKQYQEQDDAFGFVQYRNFEWTPAYVKEKQFYQAVLQENKAFLGSSASRPFYDCFENLIFIGIDLKRGLLDRQPKKIEAALKALEKDKAQVLSIQQLATKAKL